ncbi:MAG: hypothetical protein WBA05_18755 [Gordonia sp. (in: high G+C Gram-positive bacteria)]|uniref:hypothetical protein n=1 Tax=Gordonia TaxID=2053 RepID=UPI003263AB3C
MTRAPDPHQTPPPTTTRPAALSRRTVLRGAAVGTAAVAAWSLTGCATGPTQAEIDARALLPHAQSAYRQQQFAAQLAPRTTEYAEALRTVADQRGAHLQALREEINRLHSSIAGEIESSQTTPTASVEALRASLEQAGKQAATSCQNLAGYPAGLLGSISASCQTLAKVQLA